MKLSIDGIERTLEITSGIMSVLEIQPVRLYTRLLRQLYEQIHLNSEKREIVISKDNKAIPMKEVLLVTDFISMDINTRQSSSALYQWIDSEMSAHPKINEKYHLIQESEDEIISMLDLESSIPLLSNANLTLGQMIKDRKITFDTDVIDDVLEDCILTHLRLAKDFLHSPLVILGGIQDYLDRKQYFELHKMIACIGIPVLEITNKIRYSKDKGLCTEERESILRIDLDYNPI